MGSGRYSFASRTARATSLGYDTKSVHEIFTKSKMIPEMDPKGVTLRDSRDSEEHPNSLAIILALDVTGSMGSIPHYLVKEGLPNIMVNIINKGIKDPQLMFMGIGDHEYDRAPLQIGQFESSDELLDYWLTNVYLEHGGGPNLGESYLLAWMFAGLYTSIDCLEKRRQKGFLFTIGDEPVLRSLPYRATQKIMGAGQYPDYTHTELLEKAQEKYNVYHFHLKQGSNGRTQSVMDGWKKLMGDNLIVIEDKKEVNEKITEIVTSNTNEEFISAIEFKID